VEDIAISWKTLQNTAGNVSGLLGNERKTARKRGDLAVPARGNLLGGKSAKHRVGTGM